MKRYRIGNNISVTLTLTQNDGSPYILDSNVKMYAATPSQKFEVTDFTVNSNKIVWLYKGRDQKYLGPYKLTVVENDGGVDMMTVDFCNIFNLVDCSCCTGGEDASSGLNTESVEMTSGISAEQIGLSPEVEEVVREAVADYGLFALQLNSTTGKLSMTKGEKTDFSGGTLNDKGEIRISYNY